MKLYKILSIFFFLYLKVNESDLKVIIKYLLNIKKISIIIPIFNTENFLIECLNTVVAQTLSNIEIICIDDGSTDNSSEIIKDFSKMDDRIVILNQNNKGSAYSRNRGIKISKGKYISFLDSDDLYYDNYSLENLYNKATQNHAIICGGGIRKFEKINNSYIYNDTTFENESFINFEDYQYDFDYQRFIYNKNFLKINKIYFPPYLRYQDPPFFIKAMGTAKIFYAIKNITHIYRRIYKELNLNQVIDMFYGLRDCLKLEEDMKLYKLYNISLNRLNMGIFLKRAKKFNESKRLQKIIVEIMKNINDNIIQEQKLNFNINSFYQNISNEK